MIRILLVFLCGFAVPLWGGERFAGVERTEIQRVVGLCANLDPNAEAAVAALIERYPESPVGHLIKASRLYWLADYAKVESPFSEALEPALKAFRETSSKWKASHPDDLEALYLEGMSELSDARYQIEQSHWVRAFFNASAGIGKMRAVLKKDPDFHDAKLTLGLANCFLAKAPGYLKPFALLMRFKGDMDGGLALLEEARSGSLFSREEAAFYLALIHWELRDDAQSARPMIDELVEKYPGNAKYQSIRANLDYSEGQTQPCWDRLSALVESGGLEPFPKLRVDALMKLTQLNINDARFSEAAAFGKRAEDACGDYNKLRSAKAWAVLLQAETALALREIEKSLALYRRIEKPDNPEAHRRAQERLAEWKKSVVEKEGKRK